MFVTIAVHSPKPEHVEDLLSFMHRVAAALEGTPGLVGIESFREQDGDRLVAIGRWESRETFEAALPRLLGVGGRDPNWSAGPDVVFRLDQA